MEAEGFADHLHSQVVGHHLRSENTNTFFAGNPNGAAEQFGTQASILIGVGHEDRNFGFIG